MSADVTVEKVPRHVAIIMDGNRRFAKKLMMKPWMGYEWGSRKVEQILEWGSKLGIQELTLYTFSVQNFNRPKEEFDYLMQLFNKEFENLLTNRMQELQEKGVHVMFVGRLWMFGQEMQDKMNKLMELTKNNTTYTVNFAMAYGGREEVIDAVKKIAEKIKNRTITTDEITEESFGKELYMNSPPDLIIRTGGERRTSNFLIWQSNYSEWVFLEKTWPEFETEDLVAAIQDYSERERRMGK